MFFGILGSGTKTQHHSTDVWRKSRGSRGAEAGPYRCKEHVQNSD